MTQEFTQEELDQFEKEKAAGLHKYHTLKQKRALEKNKELWNEKRKSGEIVQKREVTTKKQRKASSKMGKDATKEQRVNGMITEANLVKSLLEKKNLKEAAKEVGISVPHASTTLSKMKKNGTLKEAFAELGWDAEGLARDVKGFKEYNSSKVIRVVGEGMNAREIEEMRDASNSFKAMKLASDHISATANALANNQDIKSIDNNTALLAIKSLLQKLEKEQLKLVMESCEALLIDDCKVVSE